MARSRERLCPQVGQHPVSRAVSHHHCPDAHMVPDEVVASVNVLAATVVVRQCDAPLVILVDGGGLLLMSSRSVVPRRYRITRLTCSQCWAVGCDMWRASLLTAMAMSGRVFFFFFFRARVVGHGELVRRWRLGRAGCRCCRVARCLLVRRR